MLMCYLYEQLRVRLECQLLQYNLETECLEHLALHLNS